MVSSRTVDVSGSLLHVTACNDLCSRPLLLHRGQSKPEDRSCRLFDLQSQQRLRTDAFTKPTADTPKDAGATVRSTARSLLQIPITFQRGVGSAKTAMQPKVSALCNTMVWLTVNHSFRPNLHEDNRGVCTVGPSLVSIQHYQDFNLLS